MIKYKNLIIMIILFTTILSGCVEKVQSPTKYSSNNVHIDNSYITVHNEKFEGFLDSYVDYYTGKVTQIDSSGTIIFADGTIISGKGINKVSIKLDKIQEIGIQQINGAYYSVKEI